MLVYWRVIDQWNVVPVRVLGSPNVVEVAHPVVLTEVTSGHLSTRSTNSMFLMNCIYPLVNVYITMENHHFQLENQLFLWPCSIAMLNYLYLAPQIGM